MEAAQARSAILVHTGFTRSSSRPAQSPLPLAPGAGARGVRFLKILERRPARREIKSVGRTAFKGMIAYGLKTAPPQVYPEVVSATNSACHLSPEAPLVSPIISFINQIAFFTDALRTQSALSLPRLTAPVGLHTASRSRTLSAPSVSGA